MQAAQMTVTRQGRYLRVVFENSTMMTEIRATGAMWEKWASQLAEYSALAQGKKGETS